MAMSTMMSMDLPFQPPPNEAYELLNGIKQGERVYAPINLASPLPSSPSPDLASAKSTTSAAGPLTLQQQQQQRPPPPQTLPPDYRSIPKSPLPSSNRNANADGNDSNPAGSNRINRQEEKQALRDSRAFLAQELEQNKGQLSLSPKHLQTRSIEPSSNSSYSNSNSISEPTSNGSSQERRRSTDQLLTINVDQGTPLISQQEQGERQEQGPEQEQSQEKVDRGAEEVLQEGSNNDDLQLGHRGYLPRGMDVRDALARCEDPTLGWSLQFWVTIADPMTQHVFFACPASGQCSWDPPIGAFVVPRSPDGEWWELADSTRGNRSYYYNTLTGRTQWTRPGGNAFVIPLGLIQAAALPKLEDPSTSSRIIPSTPTHNRASGVSHLSPIKTPSPTSRGYPRPPHSPYSIPRPVHSPSKSNRSSTLSPSSSYGPSQTLEAIVLGHFASGSSYVANGDSPSPTKATDHTVSEGTATSSSQPTSLSASGSGQTNGSANAGPGSRNQLTIVEEGSGNETDMSDMSFSGGGTAVGSSGWWEKRKSQVLTVKTTLSSPRRRLKSTGPGSDGTSPVDPVNALVSRGSPLRKGPGRGRITGPIMEHNESTAESTENGDVIGQRNGPGPSLPKVVSAEPIYVDHVGSVKTKRMSTGLHPLLPSEISNEILAFQAEDFARKYFATKRSGVLRQKVPVERIMEWQRTAISSPILVLSRHLQKDGITTFKVIQHVMGERERAVEGAKPMMSSSSHLNLASLALGGRKGDEGHPQRGGRLANGFSANDRDEANPSVGSGAGALDVGGGRSEKMQVLEEIRWMIQLCVAASEMRDEVYCQLVKQLTRNPNHDAVVLGFQLFCVLTNAFGPSKNFEPFVRNFLNSHKDDAADGIGVMAKYCMTKLESLAAKGARSKALTIGEIEHASDAAFYPSVYGESLDRIMELQKRAYPTLKVPVILPFLADGILALGGLQSEGIFRVPGDGDSVAELKSRMDRGHYQLKGIEDPHVAASLFKLWLRELEDPIVPSSLYNEALIASKSATESIDFVNRLPTYNRRVLLFVISFVQLFMGRGVVEKTKMTPGNLALVIAPNILRTTSNSLVTVFTNSSFESKFILQLLENMDTSIVDEGYVPSHGQAIGRV